VLIGEVSVEAEAWIAPVAGIHVTRSIATLGGAEELFRLTPWHENPRF
jgi:hypothetical protein